MSVLGVCTFGALQQLVSARSVCNSPLVGWIPPTVWSFRSMMVLLVIVVSWPYLPEPALLYAMSSVSSPTLAIPCLLTHTTVDNLAVSAQGFRRGANRVRKVCKYCHI